MSALGVGNTFRFERKESEYYVRLRLGGHAYIMPYRNPTVNYCEHGLHDSWQVLVNNWHIQRHRPRCLVWGRKGR